VLVAGAVTVALTTVAPVAAAADIQDRTRKVFPASAIEDTTLDTASLPLLRGYVGSSDGPWVEYVVLESSNKKDARARGVNHAPRLANAVGTAAVQDVRLVDGALVFPAGVDFSPVLRVEPGPTGFPPAVAEPGSVGEEGYSPLVRLPNGTVLNAPQVANHTGDHDKLVARTGRGASARGVFKETEGFYEGKEVYYVSFEASHRPIAALENATYAPALNAAPTVGSDDGTSARSGIAPFANGQTGANNPDRQGLSSALMGEGDPLNVVQSLPKNSKYSPLWDAYPTQWTQAAVAAGANTLQTDFDDVAELAEDGLVTGLGGSPWGANGLVINCPVISIE